jgi:hypothetical protein
VRDLPNSLDLLALGRELLLDELLPLLPPGRERDVHLIATAMAIVAREAEAGEGWQREIQNALTQFYQRASVSLSAPGGGEGVKIGDSELLLRFAADLRNGAFETSPSRAAAARAILWRLTMAKLREGNPQFLAANGFGRTGGKGE